MTKQERYYILINVEATETRGCSSMVEHQPSKLDTWVRFPSPASCDSGVVGNARPCQGRDRGFEPRLSLLKNSEISESFSRNNIICGCSSMVEHQPSKLDTWVRFPSPALCDSGVVGNARPCQGRDRGFEPRLSLLRTLKSQSPFDSLGNCFVNFLLCIIFFRKIFASIFFPVFSGCETGIFFKMFSQVAL